MRYFVGPYLVVVGVGLVILAWAPAWAGVYFFTAALGVGLIVATVAWWWLRRSERGWSEWERDVKNR